MHRQSSDDSDLVHGFRALAREEEQHVPDFERAVARRSTPARGGAKRVWRRWGYGLAAAGVVVLGVAVGIRVAGNENIVSPVRIDLSAASWHAPTDFLLDVPGGEFLRELPDLTRSPTAQVGAQSDGPENRS